MLEWLFGKKKQSQEEQKPKENNKSAAEQEAEDKWQYEFLVQFLSSPIWKVSILDFVDYNCVVFDSEEENKFQYTVIHNKFKELIANLFDGMMQQIGLQEERLAYLLEKGFQSKQKKIFNQLLLCDDFMKFKQLMVNRNKALEAEVVKQIEKSHEQPKIQAPKHKIRQQDILRESQRLEDDRKKKIEMEEQEMLRKVLEISRVEAEEQQLIKQVSLKAQLYDSQNHQRLQQNTHQLVQSKESIPEIKVALESIPQKKVQEIKPVKEEKQKLPKKLALLESLPPLKGQKKNEEIKQQQPAKQNGIVFEQKVEEKKHEQIMEQNKHEQKVLQSQDDRKKRLVQQRQKIRKKKEEERKKMLEQEGKVHHVQSIVLQEDGIHDTHIGISEPTEVKVSQEEIERRKQLMKKIKNRIVDDF